MHQLAMSQTATTQTAIPETAMTQPAVPQNKPRYIDSEHYRQMLVKDGERRFSEWHAAYLNYQKEYLKDLAKRR